MASPYVSSYPVARTASVAAYPYPVVRSAAVAPYPVATRTVAVAQYPVLVSVPQTITVPVARSYATVPVAGQTVAGVGGGYYPYYYPYDGISAVGLR